MREKDDGKTWFEFTREETEQLRKIQERIRAASLSETLAKVIDFYDSSITNTGFGCICPMRANMYCENPICPRKSSLNKNAFPRFYST